jgi:very-short-patch-repair endonuclease/predicted transcriptional regulator of viral defense system
MGESARQRTAAGAWQLVESQHGVVTRAQLRSLGYSPKAIAHRLERRRLHRVWRGVYVLGRPELSIEGRWMAAVLACGSGAVLSHGSAAALWEMRAPTSGRIEVSVPGRSHRHPRGLAVHRRASLSAGDRTRHRGIPVTSPVCTLVDLATQLSRSRLEAAINEADKRGLTDPEALRAAIEGFSRRPGLAVLRRTLDRRTFTLTDSELERRFLPLARSAGLGLPQTGRRLNGFRVDFHWPELGLVVETDGLRYHRTPAQQARDRTRDQAHAAAGLTALRFTHAQIRHEPEHVRATLIAVAKRLRTQVR